MRYPISAAPVVCLLFASGCNCNWPRDADLHTAAAVVRRANPALGPVFPLPTGCDKIRVYYDRKQEGSYREFHRVNGQWDDVGGELVLQHPLGYGSDDE